MSNNKQILLGAGVLALIALSPLASGAEETAGKPVLGGLLWATVLKELPSVAVAGKARAVATAAPKRGEIGGVNLLCAMEMNYKETVYGLFVLRAWREFKGTAVLTCAGREPIRLALDGTGFAPGLQLPNQSPVHSINEGVAANIEVRVPTAFAPRQLEGTYYYAGADIMGIGGAVSPFVNTDASINIAINMPAALNLSVGISISELNIRLAK